MYKKRVPFRTLSSSSKRASSSSFYRKSFRSFLGTSACLPAGICHLCQHHVDHSFLVRPRTSGNKKEQGRNPQTNEDTEGGIRLVSVHRVKDRKNCQDVKDLRDHIKKVTHHIVLQNRVRKAGGEIRTPISRLDTLSNAVIRHPRKAGVGCCSNTYIGDPHSCQSYLFVRKARFPT